jgi:hypothetical protein
MGVTSIEAKDVLDLVRQAVDMRIEQWSLLREIETRLGRDADNLDAAVDAMAAGTDDSGQITADDVEAMLDETADSGDLDNDTDKEGEEEEPTDTFMDS